MARLIDADELIEIAHRIRLDSRERIEQMIESAPTVDAVPVVRCKDCSWWDSNEKTCIEIGGLWRASDFCSWGERRDDGKID